MTVRLDSPRAAVVPVGRAVLTASLACCFGAEAMAEADPGRAREAMAFIRVVGDLRVDYRDARKPVVRENVEVASGSGFVIAPSGLVLTSLHVVDMGLDQSEDGPALTLSSGRIQVFVGEAGSVGEWDAYVVAVDEGNDLAALQLTAADLPYLPLGDADALEPGRPVQVLGFPFGRHAEVARGEGADVVPRVTVTAGSFSASREDDQGETRYLQTDASMQPGNSGGPMLDEDGYVVGVVKMKLAASATSSGAGFTVSVNVVKDFLETNGLLDRLPVTRLRPGVRHTLDWKRIALELPDGYSDRSPLRLLADGGDLGEIGFRAARVATDWPVETLEEALLAGRALPELLATTAAARRRQTLRRREPQALLGGRAASRVGSAVGTDDAGRAFRVEYAIVDLGAEKVVARQLGPADAMAFNAGLLRRSLASLEAAPLLGGLPLRPLPGSRDPLLELAPLSRGPGTVAVPSGWVQEPASRAACGELPPAAAGLALSHPSDYTLVLRALRFAEASAALEPALARCGAATALAGGSGPRAWSFRVDRLGVPIAVRQALVDGADGALLLELEAPIAKLAIVDELYAAWVGRLAGARAGSD